MILYYTARLLCLCLASFFLVNGVVGFLTAFASRAVVRTAESMRPRSAARLLFAIRVFPCALAVGVVLALCLPSYLWLEPHASSERTGWVCLTLALLGAMGCLDSLARVARAFAASWRFKRAWQQAGCETLLPGESSKAVIVEQASPLLALTGVFHPRLVVSQSVMRSLSAEELHLALQHESAHLVSRDNLKRLVILLVPRSIPFFRGFSSLDHSWAKLSEWAADDEAVHGDSRRALSLAAALLRVARIGTAPRLSFLDTSLCAGDHDLSARVDRLLGIESGSAKPLARTQSLSIGPVFGTAVGFAIFLAAWPAILSSVHRLLELFLR